MATRLSKNKLKYIRRNVGKQEPSQMAAHLKVPLDLVTAQLENGYTVPGHHGPQNAFDPFYIAFLIVVFFSPLIFSTAFYEFENLPRSLLIQTGALCIPALWFLRQSRQRSFYMAGGPALGPLAVLFGWALLSLAWSTYRYGAFSQWVHWAACGLFYLIVYNLHANRRAVDGTLHVVMATTALAALLGILQYLFGLDWVPQQVVPAATFNNKNMAAQVMVLAFPVGFVMAATAASRKLTWVYALITALTALFLFYTRSRAAWLGALVETILIVGGVWLYRRKSGTEPAFGKNRLLALVTAVSLLVVGMQLGPNALAPSSAGTVSPPATKKVGENLDLASGRHRLVLWKNTLTIIAQHPLAGVGIRNVQVHYPTAPEKRHHRLSLHTQRVHNDYLQMVAELGLPALLIFGWLWFLIIRGGVALLRNPDGAAWLPPALICLSAMAGAAVNAIFSFPFNRALPPLLLAVYLGLFFKTAALAAEQGVPHPAAKALGYKAALILAGVFSILLIGWGGTTYHWSWADHYYRRHVVAFLSGDYDRAAKLGEQALVHNPARGAILRSLSRVYVRQQDYTRADALFERIDRVFPHAPLNIYHQAVARINQKRFADAEAAIRKGLNVIPQSGKLYGLLGVVHQANNRLEDAIAAYGRAITLSPGVESHYQWLGQLLYAHKRFEEAVPVYTRWAELDPEQVEAAARLGLIALDRGQAATAAEHFRRAIELAPNDATLHRYLGVALINQEKTAEAAAAFQQAVVKSRGRDAVAQNNLGSALARQNQLERAIEHFKAALKVNPDYAEARQNLEKARKMLSAN